ncbi:MAG: adenosine deaminase [Bdellovibrionaceae bacterium]|nr:adenosine deaminase [Pseudobdellovibrionaceae bacterium]
MHRHLECSLRVATLKELARRAGIEVPDDERAFRDKFLVTTPMLDLETVLTKFLVTQKLLSSEEILERIAFECVEDAVREGIRILELRYAPTFVAQGHPHLSFESIHEAILRGITRARHLPVAVGLIAIIQRTRPLREAERVTEFAIAHRETLIGLDLADNEVGFDAKPFAPLFSKARQAGLGITVHAGEAIFAGSARAPIEAVENLGAQRIGHGLQIHNDPRAIEFFRARRIPLELCPTSNWLTNAVPSLSDHPFRRLMEQGVPVTINSDDPGVFGIDLVHEYDVLARDHRLSQQEFNQCNDVAAAASFIAHETKQKHWPRPIDKSLAPSLG